MRIIEKLYNGEISPVEDMIPSDPDYRKICWQIGEEREYFERTLSEKDKERFKRWNTLIYEYEKMIELENFSNGFKLGMQLGCEVFGQERQDGVNFEEKRRETEEMISAKK